MSKEKKKPPMKSFADLRPNATVECFLCREKKPQDGSRKFRAHHVCYDCVKTLSTTDSPSSKNQG